ncbi:hypothetical protein JCM3765_005969 [Sporobolomyces pararoseus]
MARGKQKKQESEEEKEYVVEKLKAHKRDKAGVLSYRVKWLGYDKSGEDTWEAEEALKGAPERVEAYWKTKNPEDQLDRYKVGSKEYKKLQAKIAKDAEENDEEDPEEGNNSSPRAKRAASKRSKEKSRSASPRKKRSSSSKGGGDDEKSKPSKRAKRSKKVEEKEEEPEAEAEAEEEEEGVEDEEEEEEEEASGHKPGDRAELEWEEITESTKGGSWEDLIDKIETCIAGPSDIEGRPLMLCIWKQKTPQGLPCASYVDSKICRETCPQKCLDFYETHLKFNTNTDGQGESTVEEQDDDSEREREEDDDDEVSQQESEEVEEASTTKTPVSPTKATHLNGSSKPTTIDTAE